VGTRIDLGPAIDARWAFEPERHRLLALLETLRAADLARSTDCPGWTVADIAAHLLGDDLSRLARGRDGHPGPAPEPGEDLPRFLHRINDEWVLAAKRLSPPLLAGLLDWTGQRIARFWYEQDLDRLGEPVSWAGPGPAPVWLDAARDFSEYWLHRQQIRDALGLTDDSPHDVRHLVFDTLVRGLPYALSGRVAPAGTALVVTLTGPGGGDWTALSTPDAWRLTVGAADSQPAARAVLTGDTAWRLWTRGVEPDGAPVSIEGDRSLAAAVLELISIIR
jgi:uncharacterized protein (TIGR03083 family)